MARKRILWIAVAGALLTVPVLLYFVVWLPNSLRARLDQIEIGMSESDARSLLADFPDMPDHFPEAFPTVGEVWSSRDGEVRYTKWDPPTKVYMLMRAAGDNPDQLSRSTQKGIAYVDFKDQEVIGKTWLAFPQTSVVEWVKARFR